MIDAPGGGGKIPLLPEYVEAMNEDGLVLRNYAGKTYLYKQPHDTRDDTTVPLHFEPVLVG